MQDRKLIFDLGAHYGEDSHFYLKKGFRVVAVEANPRLADEIETRLARWIRRGLLSVERAAISRAKGEAAFFVNNTWDSWSSLSAEVGSRDAGSHEIRVPTLRLEDLVARHGEPYFVKIDIEGLDYAPLMSLAKLQCRPKYLSVENGFEPMRRMILDLGYDRFKWVDQSKVAQQRLPFPAREGRFAFHRFEYGSSGAFGEEAPGRWMSEADVAKVIDAYWTREDVDAVRDGWFDLHAKLAGA